MNKENKDSQKNSGGIFKVFEIIIEFLGWLQIVASPLLIGLVIGSAIYFPNPSFTRLILGIIVAAIGLIVGIIWATRQWKGKGTIAFLSRIMGTPEFDKTAEGTKSEETSNIKVKRKL